MSDLKKELQDILHPERKDLHPPMAPPKLPEPIKIEVESKDEDIDFQAIANSSEFRRFVYFIYTGKTHRGTLRQLDWEIKRTQEAVEVVKEYARGSKSDYRAVMKELKEKLKERIAPT